MEIKEFHPNVLDASSIEKINSLSNEELQKLAELYPTRVPFIKAKSNNAFGNYNYKGLLSLRKYNLKPEVVEILETAKEAQIKPFADSNTFATKTLKKTELLEPVRVQAVEVAREIESPETATNDQVSENIQTMDAIVAEDAPKKRGKK